MIYYTQLHRWSYIYIITFIFGVLCIIAAFFYKTDIETMVGYLVTGIFSLISTFMLYKSRNHCLYISDEFIEHNGFKHWKVKKSDVVNVEHGKKSWVEDRDLFIKVHSKNQNYSVDSGFLFSEQRVEEIVMAMRE